MSAMPETDEDADEQDQDVEVQCENCEYVWMYSGELWHATCPRCSRKTKTPYHDDYQF